MSKYLVSRTVTFYWEVDAKNGKEAIEIANDIGDSKCSSHKYSPEKAKKL